jgi:hypothetical protein
MTQSNEKIRNTTTKFSNEKILADWINKLIANHDEEQTWENSSMTSIDEDDNSKNDETTSNESTQPIKNFRSKIIWIINSYLLDLISNPVKLNTFREDLVFFLNDIPIENTDNCELANHLFKYFNERVFLKLLDSISIECSHRLKAYTNLNNFDNLFDLTWLKWLNYPILVLSLAQY